MACNWIVRVKNSHIVEHIWSCDVWNIWWVPLHIETVYSSANLGEDLRQLWCCSKWCCGTIQDWRDAWAGFDIGDWNTLGVRIRELSDMEGKYAERCLMKRDQCMRPSWLELPEVLVEHVNHLSSVGLYQKTNKCNVITGFFSRLMSCICLQRGFVVRIM